MAEPKEIKELLTQPAQDKLSDITSRIRIAREGLNRITKPEKNKRSLPGITLALLFIPVLMVLFIAVLILALPVIMNPLNTTQMYGISIALIGCYIVFLNPKRGK